MRLVVKFKQQYICFGDYYCYRYNFERFDGDEQYAVELSIGTKYFFSWTVAAVATVVAVTVHHHQQQQPQKQQQRRRWLWFSEK